ncbi:MAG: hypothetical protein ACLQAN_05150 [Acidimicrobiales bacterium]
MESAEPLVYLTTVVGSVAGHLVVGRLRAEGIAAVMRGPSEGPYPFPAEIDVLVPAAKLALAEEILLGDAVDATFDGLAERRVVRRPRRQGHRRWLGRLRRRGGR